MPKRVTSLLGLLRGLAMMGGKVPLTTYSRLHNQTSTMKNLM